MMTHKAENCLAVINSRITWIIRTNIGVHDLCKVISWNSAPKFHYNKTFLLQSSQVSDKAEQIH